MQKTNLLSDEPITLEIAKWAAKQVAANWMGEAMATVALAVIVYAFMMLLGKHGTLGSGKKKLAFYGLVAIVFLVLIHICVCATDYFVRQNREFKSALLARDADSTNGFRAGFIALFNLPKPILVDSSTNAIPVTMAGIAQTPAKFEGGVNLGLILKIDNAGRPSVAWNWKAYLILPGGSKLNAHIPPMFLTGTNNQVGTIIGPYTLRMEDHLIQAMAVTPLPTGAGKLGWMGIYIEGITEVPDKSHVVATFEDVLGRETKIDYEWITRKL